MSTLRWTSSLHQFIRGLRLRRHVAARSRANADAAAVAVALAEDRPLGCGWFDSSHDLHQGLQVREADGQVLALLPLSDWLSLHVTPCNAPDTPPGAGPGIIASSTFL
jgi:hypothetical protein